MENDFYKRVFGGAEGNTEFKNEHNEPDGKRFEDSELSEEKRREAKRIFSRVGLSLFSFTAVSYAAIGVIYTVLYLILRDRIEAVTSSVYFSWALNVVSMYILALPALYLTLRRLPPIRRQGTRLRAEEFVLLFFVAEAVMMLGSMIGTTLNGVIGALLGQDITNGVSELISGSPVWLIILVAVIIGPIVEELIFRRLIIDRLAVFGDTTAVLVSGVTFGLFHGNLYQFFYAAGLGLVLGYIYTKTRNLVYPILMHMIINFTGSVLALPIMDMLTEMEAMAEALSSGAEIDYFRFLFIFGVIISYIILQYGCAVAGVVILIIKLKNGSFHISGKAELSIPRKKLISTSVLNAGMILFLAVSLIQFIINIFAG